MVELRPKYLSLDLSYLHVLIPELVDEIYRSSDSKRVVFLIDAWGIFVSEVGKLVWSALYPEMRLVV